MAFDSPEVKDNQENRKTPEKLDAIAKQEDIAKKYPELDAKEKGVLAGLDIGFDKEKGMTPDEINKGMDARFDAEIAKAGISGETQKITDGKRLLSEQIAKTTDMKEKIALYQDFLNGLKSEVGTQVAEQNQRMKDNSRSMEDETERNEKSKRENSDRQNKKDSGESIAGNSKLLFEKLAAHRLGNIVREAQGEEVIRNQEKRAAITASESKERGSADNELASTDAYGPLKIA